MKTLLAYLLSGIQQFLLQIWAMIVAIGAVFLWIAYSPYAAGAFVIAMISVFSIFDFVKKKKGESEKET